jgi:hypothetical protein
MSSITTYAADARESSKFGGYPAPCVFCEGRVPAAPECHLRLGTFRGADAIIETVPPTLLISYFICLDRLSIACHTNDHWYD